MDTPSGWDNTAKDYLFFHAFTTQFALSAVHTLIGKEPPKEKINILDVACGTGALSLTAANFQRENIHVLATDFAPKMIEMIKENIEKEGLKNIEAKVMDGQALELPNESFDYVFSLFGVIFFPDRMKGMKEFHRVLKKGGKVAITGWAKDLPLPKAMGRAFQATNLQPKNKPPPYAGSLSDPEKFAEELTSVGFKNVDVKLVTFPFRCDSAKQVVEMFKTNPALTSAIEGFSEEEKQRLWDAYEQAINELCPTGKVDLPFTATMGIGTKE